MNNSIQNIEKKNSEFKKVIENNGGRKFWDIQWDREKDDSGVNDREYKAALIMGKYNSDDFMSKVFNHNHPDHVSALSAYQDKFGGDRANVEKDFADKSVKLMGAKRLEKQNTSYENGLFSMYRINNEQDQAYMSKFKDYLRNKHAAVGYEGDADYINQFWETHPMSSKPNGTVINKISAYMKS